MQVKLGRNKNSGTQKLVLLKDHRQITLVLEAWLGMRAGRGNSTSTVRASWVHELPSPSPEPDWEIPSGKSDDDTLLIRYL